ncbi:MAG: hypothetical protein MUF45_06325 [Spirosomaceae bacterium]|jgi:hypothetical protein|nr:hypothetical protein [Spirosomataceae bacterium]
MAFLTKKENFKWVIIVTFFGLVFLPGKMPPLPALKFSVVGVMGGLCLLFQLFYLKNVAPTTESPKADIRQTLILIFLTIGVILAYFVI